MSHVESMKLSSIASTHSHLSLTLGFTLFLTNTHTLAVSLVRFCLNKEEKECDMKQALYARYHTDTRSTNYKKSGKCEKCEWKCMHVKQSKTIPKL